MKLLSRLLIALLACIIAIPAMATPVQAADITSMSLHPSSGTVGEEVYITGSCERHDDYWVYYQLDTNEWVEVLEDRDFEFESNTEDYDYSTKDDKFLIPESCSGKHTITICDKDLGSSVDDDDDVEDDEKYSKDFTVKPKVEIIEVAGDEIDDPDDAKGATGIEVTVKGTGFAEDEEDIDILFEGDVVSDEQFEANEYGTWEGTFEVPTVTKGKHDISAEGHDTDEKDVEEATFQVMPGISVDPESGSHGEAVTVTGNGFAEDEINIKILFDNDTIVSGIEADDDGCWEETFDVPQLAKGKYDITAEGSHTDKDDIEEVEFEIVPGLTLSPTQGHVGTTLSVSGSGFPKNTSVIITYDGVTMGSRTTQSNGSFSGVSFEATGTHGNHIVKATCGSDERSENFTMESVAPAAPVLTSPTAEERVGSVIGRKFTPAFEWQSVVDDSGINYYCLQIASSENFTTEATLFSRNLAVAELTSASGVNTVSYTLPENSALFYGTYYWRVKAVDNAQNESVWSVVHSFKTGLLPFWALISIASLIAVLIGALVYLLIRRRGSYD
ncbi:MAG: hypothetical protein J7L19_06690 [Dehalococcoidia bacterium]|nr:hypothetical protein [Dehalococcoidia bacterium]